ncbi:MAG TPA: metallophosphoesterase [Acetobacteraceae bacterium]|nr:metallophosphoesterase [Acetobacteraceae bacterium]
MVVFQPAPATLPPGRRVYAVGDVHGCDRQFTLLHQAIAADLAARPIAAPLILHTGDYLDRGPASAAVVGRLAGGPPLPGVETVNLRGNHEAMALAVLAGGNAESATLWLLNGAAATLASWGIDADSPAPLWARHVPPAHLRFLRALAMSHSEGGYFFAHAGVRPGVPLAAQDPADLLWIREPFLSYKGDLGAVVVHGHTPREKPVIRRNRIGIDTGAVYGGPLTAAVLEGDQIGFLQV